MTTTEAKQESPTLNADSFRKISGSFNGKHKTKESNYGATINRVLTMLKSSKKPLIASDISSKLDITSTAVYRSLEKLLKNGDLKRRKHNGIYIYEVNNETN